MPNDSVEFQVAGMLERMNSLETAMKRVETKLDQAADNISTVKVSQAREEAQVSFFSRWVEEHDAAHRFIVTTSITAAGVAVAAIGLVLLHVH